MNTLFLIIFIISAVLLICIVLVQKSKDGAVARVDMTGGLLTARGQSNLLTKITAILAILFMVSALALVILEKHESSSSVFSVLAKTSTIHAKKKSMEVPLS